MNYLSSEINKSVCHSAMWETWVLSPGWEDPLEEGMATHSSILDWRSLADYSPCGHKVRHNWTTKHTHIHTHTHTHTIHLTLLLQNRFSHSVVSNSLRLWVTTCQASLSITVSWSLPKLMSIELVMTFNHLILCCPLFYYFKSLLKSVCWYFF